MMNKLKNRFLASSGLAASLIAIVAGLIVGLIILLITNPSQAMDGFVTILKGGFSGGPKGIGNIFYLATPIIMTGLSVGFAFKTGLFNIGASGQLIVGGYVAVLIGVLAPQLGAVHWLVALLGGMVAGALWALIPGILKAIFNVHEVISSIMMNYIGMFMVNALVAETVFDSMRAQSLPVAKTAQMPTLGLDTLFKGSSVNSGIFVAIFFVIVLYIVLNKTTFGYELKACGFNRDASRYAGINAKRNIVLSMTIAGAMAGIAGGLIYLAGSGKFIEIVDVLAGEGFTGISVALLASSNPLGVLFTGVFVSYITNGGFYMQLYDFVPEIIDIIISIIIYFSALALIVRHFFDVYALKSGIGDEDIPAPDSVKTKRRSGKTKGEVDKNE